MAGGEVRASRDARVLAGQYDIDLRGVRGSGPGGEVTVKDVEELIKERYLPRVRERRPLRGIRRVIASRLSKSYREAVHVAINMEVSMDRLAGLREELAREVGVKPSYTVLIAKCVARAIRDYIEVNATLEGDEVVIYDTININIAVDTPLGLLVPVLRRVDERGLRELLKEYGDLVSRAKKGLLKEKDVIGGTFTITNLGMYGVDSFTPIINPPQVAILGVGRMTRKPYVDGETGEVKVGTFMNLSLAIDHRAIDGAPAARFLQRVKHYIEHPEEVSWL
ncbi:MAG: dihydrolipoyllysine acetyltransferase [Desulfurococcales archaeon ex4484_204]|nr:MAG: dihydrolipoyllysine acetyltransferase [Desulfurococcales archaeon ex4484_204]